MNDMEKSIAKTKHRQNILMGGQRRIGKAIHEVTHTGGKQITMAVKMTNMCEPLTFS